MYSGHSLAKWSAVWLAAPHWHDSDSPIWFLLFIDGWVLCGGRSHGFPWRNRDEGTRYAMCNVPFADAVPVWQRTVAFPMSIISDFLGTLEEGVSELQTVLSRCASVTMVCGVWWSPSLALRSRAVFCPGFHKGRVPSEKGTFSAVNGLTVKMAQLARWTEEKWHN